MEEKPLESLEKVERRGAKPGDNRGGGRKLNIERLVSTAKEEGYKIAKAEFWVKLAEDYAVPRLLSILENGKDDVALRACQELLNRAMGKPKESIDHTTNGKDLPMPILPMNHVRPNDGNAEDPGAHEADTGAPGGDVVLQDGIDALIPDSEGAGG